MQLAMVENQENLREIEQLKLGPMDIEELRILSDEKRVSIFYRGFCCGTYEVGDSFSRNFFLAQLHESGGIKIKDLARIFGMQYQYCSKLIVDYRKEGIKGIEDRRHKSKGNRLLITKKIGQEILKLRGEKKEYEEISQIIRFRFRKKIKASTICTWVCEEKKRINNELEVVQVEMEPLCAVESTAMVPAVASEGVGVGNIYAGAMVLYAMLCRGEFLKSFVDNLSSNITESWSAKRVLLTLFFLHALRLKSIEQTKHLVGRDFAQIVGGDFLKGQWLRYGVDGIVKQEVFDIAMKSHYQNLISKTYKDDKLYYTDGHFSTYYGKYTVPKGFDPRRQMPYRGRNTIYCHNSNGENVYLFESPTNTTLSQDIEVLVRDLEKHEFGLKGVTLCFDRGGWSQENFKFLRGKKMYLISYLKNRKKERLVDEVLFKPFMIIDDDGEEIIYRLYEKEVKETRYGKVRTIILLSDDGKQIPIITTNPYLKAQDVVHILKRRWREENCFKYMIEHFGIDLLTTYKTEEAPNKIISRPHPERKKINGELTTKKRELEVLRAELAKKVFECGEQSEQTIKEFYDREKELNFKIKNIQVDIDILERKRQTIPTKEKRSLKEDHVIMAQKRRLLINTVKAVNFNVEKWLQEIFKKYHAKEDETLSMIRNLCRQPGRVYQGDQVVKVELQELDNGPMSKSLDKVLENLKENGWLKLPDGRNLEIVQMH